MDRALQSRLMELFGDRVRFDENELLLYSHDVGSLPAAVEALIHNMPDAVVQPVSALEVAELVKLGRHYRVPLVPRGAGTSGYGGAMPAHGGIVVSFRRMDKILAVDPGRQTVTVEPGVIWTRLEKALAPHGLMLRLYPSSAPGSTVAGWVAEGGSGIGSYQYGYIADNVEAVEVVTPEGEIRRWEGPDLRLASRAEGITGFIVSVTLKVCRLEKKVPVAAYFADLGSLVQVLQQARQERWPLWHAAISTATLVSRRADGLAAAERLQAQVAGGAGHGGRGQSGEGSAEASRQGSAHGSGQEHGPGRAGGHTPGAVPPGNHVLLLVYTQSQRPDLDGKIQAAIAAHGGTLLPEAVARHELEESVYPMRLKVAGPSLIPSEAVVPIDNLAAVVQEGVDHLKDISIEATLLGPDQATLLCFMLGDRRTLAFTPGFAKSLAMMEIAKRHGGRAYSVGLYFTDEAEAALGKEHLQLLAAYKARHDPDNVFNPGKILKGTGNPALIRASMRVARASGSLVDLAERLASHTPHMKRSLAESVTAAAYACAQCSYCEDVCTEYQGVGWESASPRGKWLFLQHYLEGRAKWDQKTVDSFLMCTTCKRCNDVCQVNLPIQELWDQMRTPLVQDFHYSTFPAFEMMGSSIESDLNIWAGRRHERDAWVPDDVAILPEAEVAYWAGCTASFVQSDIAENAVHILKEGGVPFTYLGQDEACCGIPMLMAGKPQQFELAFRNNVEQMHKRGVQEIIISCPGCWVAWTHYYPQWAQKLGLKFDFRIRHLSEVTAALVEEGRLHFKQPVHKTVTWHDSCHIGRHGGIYDAPRKTLQAIPGLELREMASTRENALCCGSVLTRVKDPEVSNRLAGMRLQEAQDTGADAVVSTCPCCEFQLRVGAAETHRDVPVEDFAGLVAQALGYPVRNTTEISLEMWSVFAKAIRAMTSEGVIQMMGQMLPEIVAAMPPAMQPAVKGMAAMPGVMQKPALAAMEKMMPLMMPALFPAMLPKLMPKVLELMEQEIPNMPPSMKEKLPAMLPKVMAAIMPGMMAEVAAGLAPRLTRYIREAM
ncbi:MAG: FAD-binding oxidoreductase [Firmicutes bacterium]|nr:FAD-binding oxidoreductase [Bacillota bacterium]